MYCIIVVTHKSRPQFIGFNCFYISTQQINIAQNYVLCVKDVNTFACTCINEYMCVKCLYQI